jgi:hypothetical protein
MILTINRDTGTIYTFHRLAHVTEAVLSERYKLNLYVIAAVVHMSTLKLDFCSQKDKREKAMPLGTSGSHGQFPLSVHKRKVVLPLIRQQNWAMSTLCPQTKSCPSPK